MPIQVLENSLINKIAAGEVVERPLSVVKETVENALDANAKNITIEIKDGGVSVIRVTDDGAGIEKSDLKTAFLRHATSKIKDYDDLTNVRTMGFRGEALSSIAAVSQLEMLTKTLDAREGTQIVIHGGQIISVTDKGAANGTTLIIRNLFYNTPARRKFLKKPQTEAALIHECIGRFALAHSNVAFRFINNNQTVVTTNGAGDLKTAAFYVYGKDITKAVIDIKSGEKSADTGGIALSGFVCAPSFCRGNRSYGNFFLNGRYIKNAIVQQAVEDAYKNMLPIGKFPVYALNMTIPPKRVDINVHPAKIEARFDNDTEIYQSIFEAVSEALADGGDALVTNAGAVLRAQTADYTARAAAFTVPAAERGINGILSPQTAAYTQPKYNPMSAAVPAAVNHLSSDAPPPAPDDTDCPLFENARIIGQIMNTYFILEKDETMFLLDQHAAHERVLFEELKKRLCENNIPAQMVLTGEVITLSPTGAHALRENAEFFNKLGFEFDEYGKDAFMLRAVPYIFNNPAGGVFFAEVADAFADAAGRHTDEAGLYDYKIDTIAAAACKAAVKANRRMNATECAALLTQMESLENPYTCPHGRPTFITMSKYDIEKAFLRV